MLCGLIEPELIDSLLIGYQGFPRAVNNDVEAEGQGSHPLGPVEIERRNHGSNQRRVRQGANTSVPLSTCPSDEDPVSFDFQIIPH